MILIFGSEGQLAQSFKLLELKDAVFVGQQRASFVDELQIVGALNEFNPKIIINCSAYTKVDQAEAERQLALKINADALQIIGKWANVHAAKVIHFSTDYVFSGDGVGAWREDDCTSPCNWYGQTKLMGEKALAGSECDYLIFRISWVYSQFGANFVKTMLRLGNEKEKLSIVSDQIGSPTFAFDIANIIHEIMQRPSFKSAKGIYHLGGADHVSWYDFAREIFSQAKDLGFDIHVKDIRPVLTSEYPTPARRPLNSRLNSEKIRKDFSIELPNWRESLHNCLLALKRNK